MIVPAVKTFSLRENAFHWLECVKNEPYAFFLDSSLRHRHWGRYSVVGFDPFDVVCGHAPRDWRNLKTHFRLHSSAFSKKFPVQAGAVGFLSYDFGCMLQGIEVEKNKDNKVPGFLFGFYDRLIVIDHFAKKMHLVSTGLPEKNSRARALRARMRLEQMIRKLNVMPAKVRPSGETSLQRAGIPTRSCWIPASAGMRKLDFQSNFSKAQYVQAVRQVLEHIRRGDIYEINLSQRVEVKAPQVRWMSHALPIYERLRALSPSSFGAYFDGGSFKILSSSPEQFLHLKDGRALIRPMKGTRPRMAEKHKDSVMRMELLKSPKEIAELLMVTDLERNDLGRVCEFGSIKVRRARAIEKYKTVYQATSTIEGKLRRDKDCFDLLEATFPGGSVTGCPKLRAMEIIDALEPNRRGVYTGALGYIGFDGNLDFNILIRTLVLDPQGANFHVGGGIVADSNPQKEYDETWVKARAMVQALEEVTHGKN